MRLLCTFVLLGACSGMIEEPANELPELEGTGEREPTLDPEGEGLSEPAHCEGVVGPRLVRRLSAQHYRNSLVSIFGSDEGVPDADVLPDPIINGFRVDARAAVIRDLGAQQVMMHAERVASWAVDNKLDLLTTCRDTSETCRDAFVDSFGRRAFRGPLNDAQRSVYRDLFAAEESFEAAAEVVIAAMLQSPHFLYRLEIGEPEGSSHRLTAYEKASALSYLATERPPDEVLLQAADEGRLESADDLERELDRLLDTPQSRDAIAHFVSEWLEIDDLPTRIKADEGNLTPELRQSMLAETTDLYAALLRDVESFESLLSAPFTYADNALRQHYGISGGEGRVDLDGSSRAPGLLGHASVLARHSSPDASSPVQRGVLVRERLLCQELQDPPPGIDTDIDSAQSDAATTRERYVEHTANAICYRCHALIDPIGFAFEHFDAFGRFRADENGHPIDASGHVAELRDEDVPVDGLDELAAFLATSPEASACHAHYLSYFAFGIEGCGAQELEVAQDPSTSLRDVLVALVRSDHFQTRVD